MSIYQECHDCGKRRATEREKVSGRPYMECDRCGSRYVTGEQFGRTADEYSRRVAAVQAMHSPSFGVGAVAAALGLNGASGAVAVAAAFPMILAALLLAVAGLYALIMSR